MELRHLRYFVAVAEEGSLSLAAQRRLHTAQPSLSRQIRGLEAELGATLLIRSGRGIELTAAGRVFLDHARLLLLQADAARLAARRAAEPAKTSFAAGFLTGQEMSWLPALTAVLQNELPRTELTISSQLSPELAKALAAGLLDVAFLRREANVSGIAYRDLIREKLLVILRADDKLAAHRRIRPSHLRGRTLIGVPMATAPVLRTVLDAYAAEAGIDLTPQHQADNVSMTISLVASTRGVALLPEFARRLLPASVVSRPLAASEPTIELVLGYSSASRSPLLKLLLARTDELVRYAAGAA